MRRMKYMLVKDYSGLLYFSGRGLTGLPGPVTYLLSEVPTWQASPVVIPPGSSPGVALNPRERYDVAEGEIAMRPVIGRTERSGHQTEGVEL
ncbi:MAG TPA: hypothetical protein DDY39_11845 [Nitrospira sp.]|nr:hypothetical protein [Nitrospira sp.]